MSFSATIKIIVAFPLAFLLGVIAMALFQLYQIGGAAITVMLGGGLLCLIAIDRRAGDAGNTAILRSFAKYSNDPDATNARIDAQEAEDAKPSPGLRVLQISGFAAAVLACLIWSPNDVLDWVLRRPFL